MVFGTSLKPGNVAIYRTYDAIGNVVRRERRRIIRLLKNVNRQTIIEWESHKAHGICMPSTWQEWRNGVDEGRRRRTTVIRYRGGEQTGV